MLGKCTCNHFRRNCTWNTLRCTLHVYGLVVMVWWFVQQSCRMQAPQNFGGLGHRMPMVLL
eukprot:1928457-Amphidinium_carterae.1